MTEEPHLDRGVPADEASWTRILIGLLIVAAIVFIAFVACGPDPPRYRGGWFKGPQMRAGRGELAAATDGHEILLAGGIAGLGRTVRSVEGLSVEAGTWRTFPPLPLAVNHTSLVSDGRVFYLTGGATSALGSAATDNAYVYDAALGGWTALPDMPRTRSAHGAAIVDGVLYVVGGTGGVDSDLIMALSLETQRWSFAPPLPTPRDHLGVVAVQGQIYALGGRSGGRIYDVLEIYDPRTETWSPGREMISARSGFAIASDGARIYVAGGEDPGLLGRVLGSAEVFDLRLGTWGSLPNMPTARHGMPGVMADGRFYVLGGSTWHGMFSPLGWSNQVDMYAP